jgi:hypothetical protein
VTLRLTVLVLACCMPPAMQAEPPAPAEPAVPYESHGACPFECCTYRTWTVQTDTDILVDRQDDAPVAFRVHRGQRVEGVTGVVVTTTLGRAIVRRESALGEGSDSVPVQPGDPVYVLHYVGEGYWKFWVRGKVGSEQLPEKDDVCVGHDGQTMPCAVQITVQPETTWWAKIRHDGQEGWTSKVGNFSDIDACG